MNENTAAPPSLWTQLKQTANGWLEDNALRLSAALAYYSVFSIAPLLVLSVGLAGWFFGADAVRGHLDDQLRQLVGKQAAEAIQSMVQSTSKPSASLAATVVGLVTLLIGASGVFGQLKDALNTIWEVKPKSGLGMKVFIRERLLSFGMVLVIGFLLLVSFLLTTLLSALNHWMETILQLPSWIWGGAGMLVSFTVIALLFALLFKVLPDVHIDWRHVWVGAAATAFLFEIGKFGLAYYLSRESTASSFGAAGSVVLLLLWVYYASCILLFGAEFTKVYTAAHGGKLRPTELAEPVTAEARAQQGMTPVPTTSPPRESLLAMRLHTNGSTPAFPKTLEELPAYISAYPLASFGSALGLGMMVGLASRAVRGNKPIDPQSEVRLTSRALGAGLLLLAS